MNARTERFLKFQDHCRLATISQDGFPHCVPVGFWFSGDAIYIPTNSRSVKARNLARNSKCCVIVDLYEKGKGQGVMVQGSGRLALGKDFLRKKEHVESSTGWKLDGWRVGHRGRDRVDAIIIIRPTKTIEIGLQENR